MAELWISYAGYKGQGCLRGLVVLVWTWGNIVTVGNKKEYGQDGEMKGRRLWAGGRRGAMQSHICFICVVLTATMLG